MIFTDPHLNNEQLDEDRNQMIQRAVAVGVKRFLFLFF